MPFTDMENRFMTNLPVTVIYEWVPIAPKCNPFEIVPTWEHDYILVPSCVMYELRMTVLGRDRVIGEEEGNEE